MMNFINDTMGAFSLSLLFTMISVLFLSFIQNISFSIVSRSRNRNNMSYHIVAASFSNVIWFVTFKELVLADMNNWLLIPYWFGSVFGSLVGVKVSIFIERLLGASADGHLNGNIKQKTGFKTSLLYLWWLHVRYAFKKPKTDLERFLIEHHLYARFVFNLYNFGFPVLYKDFWTLIKENPEENLTLSFDWGLTFEGSEFWCNVNSKYEQFIKTNGKIK